MYISTWIVLAVALHFLMKKQYPTKVEWDQKKKKRHSIVYYYLFPLLFAPALLAMLGSIFGSYI